MPKDPKTDPQDEDLIIEQPIGDAKPPVPPKQLNPVTEMVIAPPQGAIPLPQKAVKPAKGPEPVEIIPDVQHDADDVGRVLVMGTDGNPVPGPRITISSTPPASGRVGDIHFVV